MTDPTDHLAERLDRGHASASACRPRGRDAVVGLRRFRDAVRHVPAARPAARRVRADRRRRRGAPPDGHRAGAVALHFPWDNVEDPSALRDHVAERGLRIGAVNPNLFQDPDYKLGSVAHPDPAVRRKAIEHLLECMRIARRSARLRSRCGWPTARTTRARTSSARRRRLLECLREVYAALPPEQELLLEYKLFEPAFYATDVADWGSSLLLCQKLGERAKVLVDLGHHAQGDQRRADRLDPRRRAAARRLSLQQPKVRRRRSDRRLGESVRAVSDLLRADRLRSGCRD